MGDCGKRADEDGSSNLRSDWGGTIGSDDMGSDKPDVAGGEFDS